MTTLQLRLAPIRDHDKCNSGIQAPSTSVNGINGQISESKERYLSAVIEARSMPRDDTCRFHCKVANSLQQCHWLVRYFILRVHAQLLTARCKRCNNKNKLLTCGC